MGRHYARCSGERFTGKRRPAQIDANDQITVAEGYANVPIAWRNAWSTANTRQAARMNQTPALINNITKTASTTVSINSNSTSLVEV